MTESSLSPAAPWRRGPIARRRAAAARSHRLTRARAACWLFALGNLVGDPLITLFGRGSGRRRSATTGTRSTTSLLGVGRLTAFLAGYFALIEVILLARLPFLERLVGFDRLTVWHRWNGHAVIYLALAHVVCTVWGYAKQDGLELVPGVLALAHAAAAEGARVVLRGERRRRRRLSINLGAPTTSPYPGIITATIGTFLLVVVLVTSLVIVRRKLSYEWWYAIHFTAYAGIALAWFHMIPDGNELIVDENAADYWRALFVFALVARALVPALAGR